ncbi:MAG TPA: TetR/AcrR family transcriptional regulator [Gemmatimonadales bacterium]|jgi:AcrR family transcriptional regulator
MSDEETKARLQREAQRLFALRGFRGASVRDITGAAHANLGAITYHFGTKRALYGAVVETVFARLAERVEAAAGGPAPGLERLRAIVGAIFAFFRETPEAPRLVLHQVLAGEGIPTFAQPYLRRNLAAIAQVVRDGRARGEFRAADPTLVAFTIISQSVWFALVGREIVGILGGLPGAGDVADRVERHVVDVATRFLEES